MDLEMGMVQEGWETQGMAHKPPCQGSGNEASVKSTPYKKDLG